MEKILVTGGAGYIGSVLVPELLKLNFKVTVIDNFMYNQNSLLDCCAFEHFNVIRGDVRDENIIKRHVTSADYIIPLAALVGAPLCKRDQIGARTINLDAIELITKITSKDQRILIPITNSGYGIGQEGVYCTEETPINPISLYGKLKMESEKIVLEKGNAISFRLATVFGSSPRMRIDLLVNDFTYRAVKDRFNIIFEGSFKRNYIHVKDVTRVFVHGITNFESMKNEIYNVGLSDANLSKLELCAKIKEYVPKFIFIESPIGEDPDKRDYIVSNEKIENTGFNPEYTIDMGIQELIKCFTVLNNNRFGNV